MKVYALPESLPAPKVDYANYNREKVVADEEAHKAALKAHLIKMGYTGKNTGKVVSFGVADGYAQYMLADGKGSFLVHLPYGDAYQFNAVQYMPKKAILEEVARGERLAALFAKS